MPDLPLVTRLWFAWACFFRVLLDGAFAKRAFDLARGVAPTADPPALPAPPSGRTPPSSGRADGGSARQLLALFQRDGRFVDFLEQDIASFSDGEIGGVARVVHDGCRKALRQHAKLAPVRTEEEGTRVTLAAGFNPAEVKLSGKVRGDPPYDGVLRHKGWRALRLELPAAVPGHDASILAPAEVEL